MKRGVDPEASTSSRERKEERGILSPSARKKTSRGPPPPLPVVPKRISIPPPPRALAAANNAASPPRTQSTDMNDDVSPISPLRSSVQKIKILKQRSGSGVAFSTRITSGKNTSGVVVGVEGGNVLVSWSSAPKEIISHKREELTGIMRST